METRSFDAADTMRIAVTLSSLSIALAIFTRGDGPALGTVHLLPAVFVAAGFFTVGACLLAMDEIWADFELRYRWDLLGRRHTLHPTLSPSAYLALVRLTWGMWLLGTGYYILLLDVAR